LPVEDQSVRSAVPARPRSAAPFGGWAMRVWLSEAMPMAMHTKWRACP